MIYGLFGYYKVSAKGDDATDLLNICMQRRYPYKQIKAPADGEIILLFKSTDFRRVSKDCAACGVHIEITEKRGLPYFLYRYRKRAGIMVGALVSVIMVLYFSSIIWEVRISGNSTLTDGEVIDALEECGFGVGMSKIGFRADVLENLVLINENRLAWISVNVKGTVANVEVRESQKPSSEESKAPANIVAKRSGVIERIELEEGNVIVGAGDRVNEGELLVSGIYDSNVTGYRVTRAKARVYARCVREINIFIPRDYKKRVYDEKKQIETEYSINFFGKEIKFSKKCGNEGGGCDIIERRKSLTLLEGVGLPISLDTVWHVPYTFVEARRTDDELVRLAYFELSRQLTDATGGTELIRKTVEESSDEKGFYLSCTVLCVEDIARVVEFEVVE